MAEKRFGVINIPLDLTVEILQRLPAKSLARFRCVSSQWESLINNFIVIDSIVTGRLNPPTRDPHFFFDKCLNKQRPCRRSTFYQSFSILSYTYFYHQVTDEEQLYHEEIVGKSEGRLKGFQYVRGLMGFWCSDNGQFRIHNPTTRQSLSLPITRLPETSFYLFGYDPFKNQYKVLCLTYQQDQSCKIFILGDPSEEWWDIQCSIGPHFLRGEAVCINGTIYYKATTKKGSQVLVSFNVRHEKFNHVETPKYLLSFHYGNSTLVNYHGKLGCICDNFKMNQNDVDLWVMQDSEKQEWSKITILDMAPQGLPTWNLRFAGVTHPGGEFVLVHQEYLSELALDVYYYDPKLNSHRRAEIQTTTSLFRVRPSDYVRIWGVTDHVENIMPLKFGIS